jgi:adenylate cyclase
LTGERVVRRLAAILAADVVGYSRLMGRDEQGTLARLKAHRTERLDSALIRHGGRLVKLTGDGALVEFPSAVDALSAAIEFQQAMAEANKDQPMDAAIVFRVGLHVGDLIVDGDDLYGDGVNVAARLEGEAAPGGIVVSGALHEATAGRLQASFVDLGRLSLKNIDRQVQAYRVEWNKSPQQPQVTTAKSDTAAAAVPLPLPDKPSIAVLPFQNMSGDPEQEYFVDGLVEDIITALSRFKSLFVIARNSSFTYKGRSIDIKQVSRDLGVRYVLEGSVRKAGGRVRITGQLIDSQTGAHLWAERYDRQLEDIFSVQEEVTRAIVIAVEPAIQSADIARAARSQPTDLTAYNLAQKAWFLLAGDGKFGAVASPTEETMAMARTALQRDPHCMLAMNTLGYCYWARAFFGFAPFEESLRLGLAITDRALAIEARDHQVYVTRGRLLHALRQFAPALRCLEQAHDLNPNDAQSLGILGWVEACCGETSSGVARMLAALRQDPRNPFNARTYVQISMGYFVAQEYAEGLKWALRAQAEARSPPAVHVTLLHLVGLGRLEEANIEYVELKRLSPDYVRARLEQKGFAPYKRTDDQDRNLRHLQIAAGLLQQ